MLEVPHSRVCHEYCSNPCQHLPVCATWQLSVPCSCEVKGLMWQLLNFATIWLLCSRIRSYPTCLLCAADEVKGLMWQLLVTIKYLHSQHVWHRDMKSQVGLRTGL